LGSHSDGKEHQKQREREKERERERERDRKEVSFLPSAREKGEEGHDAPAELAPLRTVSQYTKKFK
jgi:hypothetical protein